MRLIAVALFASLAIAVPASSQTADSSAAPADAKPAKAKKICRSIQVTGQRIPRRECKTEEEWANIDAARDDLEGVRLRIDRPQGN